MTAWQTDASKKWRVVSPLSEPCSWQRFKIIACKTMITFIWWYDAKLTYIKCQGWHIESRKQLLFFGTKCRCHRSVPQSFQLQSWWQCNPKLRKPSVGKADMSKKVCVNYLTYWKNTWISKCCSKKKRPRIPHTQSSLRVYKAKAWKHQVLEVLQICITFKPSFEPYALIHNRRRPKLCFPSCGKAKCFKELTFPMSLKAKTWKPSLENWSRKKTHHRRRVKDTNLEGQG